MVERTSTQELKKQKLLGDWSHWPTFDAPQREIVERVLSSGLVNQWTGKEVEAFEGEYARYLGRRHAVAVMNGTVALELALRALGIGEGDEVITTPRTFIATAGAVVLTGGTPIFADVDRDSGNITAETIERALTPRTRAIIVVHLGGWPAEMAKIMDLANSRGIVVIEDCAQAHGATIGDVPVGAFGHIAAFSFCQDKIITTGGEGGLVALDDDGAWRTAWSYKDHGKDYETVFNVEHAPGFRWLHHSFGSNWRMMELQAALGRYQLSRLDSAVEIRNRNARLWQEALDPLDALRIPTVNEGDTHAYYKFYAYVEPEVLKQGWDRDRLQSAISEAGVPVTSGSCSEIYLERAFTSLGLAPAERLPVARELGDTSLMFQVHPTLSEEVVAEAAELVAQIVRDATR